MPNDIRSKEAFTRGQYLAKRKTFLAGGLGLLATLFLCGGHSIIGALLVGAAIISAISAVNSAVVACATALALDAAKED